jgi:hypothetical protein
MPPASLPSQNRQRKWYIILTGKPVIKGLLAVLFGAGEALAVGQMKEVDVIEWTQIVRHGKMD